MRADELTVEARLGAHLTDWLGAWPPAGPLTVVGHPGRARPGWDGQVHDVLGVSTADGAVLSVRPELAEPARGAATSWAGLAEGLPTALGRPEARGFYGTFRFSTAPTDLPDAGEWLPTDDPRLPDWLRPFAPHVLVHLHNGRYAAGVGLKRHNQFGLELAVGTDERYRGRGLAARLVAQAARHVLAAGGVPIYLHDPANTASARTASAAGFPDLGWQVFALATTPTPP
jgi:GNAT superfamily N-acetyltransferase